MSCLCMRSKGSFQYHGFPLHVSSLHDDAAAVERLLHRGADPNVKSYSAGGFTALHTAAYEDHARVIDVLLEGGADSESVDAHGNTPLMVAAFHGSAAAAKALLRGGAAADFKVKHGFQPVHAAALNCHDKVLRLLLADGADADERTDAGNSPLHLAVDSGVGAARALTAAMQQHGESDEDVGRRKRPAPLKQPTLKQRAQTVLVLLTHGANPELQNSQGDTPLHRAAYTGALELSLALTSGMPGAAERARERVKRATAAGAVPDSHPLGDAGVWEEDALSPMAPHTPKTPLLTPKAKASKFTLMKLLSGKSSFGAGSGRWTAPMHSVSGVDLEARNAEGKRPLHLAAAKGAVDVVEALLRAGAAPSPQDDQGFTPLHCASRSDVARALLEGGADAAQQAGNEMDAMQWAALHEKKEVLDALVINRLNHLSRDDVAKAA